MRVLRFVPYKAITVIVAYHPAKTLAESFVIFFNLFLGVFPALASEGVTAFVDALDKIPSEEMFTAITPLLAEHWLSLSYYGIHLLLVSAFTVTGIVLFLLKVKAVRLAPPPAALSVKDMAVNGYVNVGMLLAIIPLIGATALSLFA